MLDFLKRYFSHPSHVVKDKLLGKLAYIESEHGNVWAGSYSDRKNEIRLTMFIRADEPLFDGDSREYVIDILECYEEIIGEIRNHVIAEYPEMKVPGLSIDYVTVEVDGEDKIAELILHAGDVEIGAILSDTNVKEIIVY